MARCPRSKSAGGPELLRRRAVQGEVSGALQQAEDGQVDRRSDRRRDPDRDAELLGRG
jgi:hypothetical protein